MKTTLKQDLIAKMKANADLRIRERDSEWKEWFDNGGIFDAIKYPELGKAPSERTSSDILAIVQREIKMKRESDK
jgi:hypothetical protein